MADAAVSFGVIRYAASHTAAPHAALRPHTARIQPFLAVAPSHKQHSAFLPIDIRRATPLALAACYEVEILEFYQVQHGHSLPGGVPQLGAEVYCAKRR